LPPYSFQAPAPVIGIVGWKNSGKTTLVVRLVEEFSRRGLHVSTLKHAHHKLQLDDGATDSARHRSAGARQVAVVSSRRWALITEHEEGDELDFADVLNKLDPCDLIIVEGYKSQPIPKIEVRRQGTVTHSHLSVGDSNVIALVTDENVSEEPLPHFNSNDISQIADFIYHTLLKAQRNVRIYGDQDI